MKSIYTNAGLVLSESQIEDDASKKSLLNVRAKKRRGLPAATHQ